MDSALKSEIDAVRRSASLSDMPHISALRVRGEDAFDALDALVPADLFIRDGQMLHSLLLDPQGAPRADLYLCRDDEEFIMLAEGMDAAEIREYAGNHLPSRLDVSFEDLGETHEVYSLNGPYCWEVLAEWMGPDIVGIPYLTFFRLEGKGLIEGIDDWEPIGVCFRAGKTGEYGYDLLVEREHAAKALERLTLIGESLELRRVGLSALDQCALENGFFNVRAAVWTGLTPLELQLQWRISYRKEYVGAAALRERRAKGASQRTTHCLAARSIAPGDVVTLKGKPAGTIHVAGYSSTREQWIGQALLHRHVAHAGIDHFLVHHGDMSIPLRTLSAPVINNRSLYVDPRRHSVRYRDDDVFPPLVLDEEGRSKASWEG